MSFRELKAQARAILHDVMKIPALYIVEGEEPVACSVRVHRSDKALGDLKGTSFGYAETHEIIPRIIFLASEIAAPDNNAVVSISATEMYCIDNVLPLDGITITVEATLLSAADRVGMPYPGSA